MRDGQKVVGYAMMLFRHVRVKCFSLYRSDINADHNVDQASLPTLTSNEKQRTISLRFV